MKFQDERPKTGYAPRRIDWAAVKISLMENPGKWGLIAERVSTSNVTQIRYGKNSHFRDELDDFEFISHRPTAADAAAKGGDAAAEEFEPYPLGYSDLWGCYKPEKGADAPVQGRKRQVEKDGA